MVIDTSALLAILKVEPEALTLCALGSGGLAPLRQRTSQRGVEPGRLLQLWPGTSPGCTAAVQGG
jgi:hypothetical protein